MTTEITPVKFLIFASCKNENHTFCGTAVPAKWPYAVNLTEVCACRCHYKPVIAALIASAHEAQGTVKLL